MAVDNNYLYESTTSYKLIYIFRLDVASHDGLLKIGDASIETDVLPSQLPPNCHALNQAAKERIRKYSTTLGIMPQLLYTELAVKQWIDKTGKERLDSFRDHQVHDVLKRSGIKQVRPNQVRANDWYETDLETAKNAIAAYKEGRKTLYGSEITDVNDVEIILREEQEAAIKQTIKVFKAGDQMLWNAKMRYGKTVTALAFVKRQLDKYKKTLIITHRPVVESGWKNDFYLLFKKKECVFLAKDRESDLPGESEQIDYANEIQLKGYDKGKQPFIYFASIQDLRGSERVGGKFNKNNAVFDMAWDLVINDEAHEGTQTQLGLNVSSAVKKKHTKLLSLSGTPFNIMHQYDNEAIYTWDYVMEQTKKNEWDTLHPGDPNPYAGLPKMHIYTFHLGDIIRGYSPELEGKAFNFTEFFRTWTGDPQRDGRAVSPGDIGEFANYHDVEKFLNLITKDSEKSSYPFSSLKYRDMFRHTLWMVPGVREAKALSKMLQNHPVFRYFEVANVAGKGDEYEDEHASDALELVRKTIRDNEYTITLSCGKLTTGVTIPEWTACFMLSGAYTTAAANYLQTIFRVQSPGSIMGKVKENCYVFDFAPDRALRVIADAARVSRKGGTGGGVKDDEHRARMQAFLNFCPVIAIEGTRMQSYSVDSMMQQIKHIYAERAVNSGFEDSSIYNENLMKLDELALQDFENLKKIIGSSKENNKASKVPVSEEGFTEAEYERIVELKKKKKRELTEEEKAELERLKKLREEKAKAISILRNVSIRMPLMIFGADVPLSEDITIEKFIDLVDESSWEEFMPKKVTKQIFNKFIKYYDKDVFIAAAKQIRMRAKRTDEMLPIELVQNMALIHSVFKNPDKETVLTPWRVVNMHMSDCLGGYCFYNEAFDEKEKLETPRFIDRGEVTAKTLANPDARILEINSKTGLYPLYVAYSIYLAKCKDMERKNPNKDKTELTDKRMAEIWAETIQDNLFIICKTPMAKAITRRTLAGYKDIKVNTHSFDDLVNQLKSKPEKFIKKITNGHFWNREVKKMEFDAIVGNPPYQIMDGGAKSSATPVYHLFVNGAISIKPNYISFVTPSRWFAGGKGLDGFRETMLQDRRIFKVVDYENANDIFPGVDISGGVSYFLWDSLYRGNALVVSNRNGEVYASKRNLNEFKILLRDGRSSSIIHKTLALNETTMDMQVSARKPFGLATTVKPLETGDLELYYLGGVGRYKSNLVRTGLSMIRKYKVLTSYVGYDHAGNADSDGMRRVLSKIIIAPPQSVCSETYLVIGYFDDELSAKNLVAYMKTKFFRFLLSQFMVSHHITR